MSECLSIRHACFLPVSRTGKRHNGEKGIIMAYQTVYHFVIWNMTFCFEKGYNNTLVIPPLYHFETVYTLNMNFAQ
jgi:hypothetical protein